MATFEIYQGDAEQILDLMESNSVDCIFTSPNPPKTIEELMKLLTIMHGCKRVLKPTGRLWVNISNQYRNQKTGGILHMAERFVLHMERQGWISRDNLIWWRYPHDKSKQKDPLRFRHDWEDIYGFTYDGTAYFNDRLGIHGSSILQYPYKRPKPGEFKSGYPEKLIEVLLKTTTKPGDTVLDPFAGGGVTGVVALRIGRNFIGIEIRDDAYCAKIVERLSRIT